MAAPIQEERQAEFEKFRSDCEDLTALKEHLRPQQGTARLFGRKKLPESHSRLSRTYSIVFDLLQDIYKPVEDHSTAILDSFFDYFHHVVEVAKPTTAKNLNTEAVAAKDPSSKKVAKDPIYILFDKLAKTPEFSDLVAKSETEIVTMQSEVKAALTDIIEFYLSDHNYQPQKGAYFQFPRKILQFARHWRKDYLYRGEIEKTKTNQLLIALIDRLAFININCVTSLKKFVDENSDKKDFFTRLIIFLHDIFADVQNNLYSILNSTFTEIKEKLITKYLTLLKAENLHNDGLYNNLEQFINAYIFSAEEEVEIIKATILQSFAPAKLFQAKRLLLGLSNELFAVKNEWKTKHEQICSQLKSLKKCINRLAQDSGIGLHIAKRDQQGNNFAPIYVSHTPQAAIIRSKKQRDRQIKNQNTRVSKTSATFMAPGEGGVAAFGIYAFMASLALSFAAPLAIVLGLLVFSGATFCSYFLVRDDTISVLNKIRRKIWATKRDGSQGYVRAIWVDQHGYEISTLKKIFIMVLGMASFAGGFSYGVLSASSLYSGIFAHFLGSSLAAMVIGGTLAFLPVVFTAISITCIFFVVISDIITNERWNDIYHYFKRGANGLRAMDWRLKNGAFFKSLGKATGLFLFNATKLAIGLALNIILTVASIGMFHAKGIQVLNWITSNSHGASKASLVFASINGFTGFFFGIKKVNLIFGKITAKKALVGIVSLPFVIATAATAVAECAVRFVAKTLLELGAFLSRSKTLKNYSDNKTSFKPNMTRYISLFFIKHVSKAFKKIKNKLFKQDSAKNQHKLATNQKSANAGHPKDSSTKVAEVILTLKEKESEVGKAISKLTTRGNAAGQGMLASNTQEAKNAIAQYVLHTMGISGSGLTSSGLAAVAFFVYSYFSNYIPMSAAVEGRQIKSAAGNCAGLFANTNKQYTISSSSSKPSSTPTA